MSTPFSPADRIDPPFRWEGLYASAQRFAQACVDNYSVKDAAFFFLHAGASVELAVKAALCRASPVLLIEGGGRFKERALLRLSGFEPTVSGNDQVFTVGFTQAVERFKLLYGNDALGVGADALSSLKGARDVTAHGGFVAQATGDSLFRVFVTLAAVQNTLTPIPDSTPTAFWGEAWPTVERALRQQKDDLKQQLDVAYAAARRRFAERTRDLDEDAISGLLEQAGDRVNPAKGVMPRKCPVCSGKGLSVERPEQRTILGSGGPIVLHGWLATNFSCPVCHLTLESEALVGAAPEFEAWDSADEYDLLDVWERDMTDFDRPADPDEEPSLEAR